MVLLPVFLVFFFFNDTATTEIYTLSLHDALPISLPGSFHQHLRQRRQTFLILFCRSDGNPNRLRKPHPSQRPHDHSRSEEHTSELQSPCNLVCRLLLEKKKNLNPVNSTTRMTITP